MIPGACRADVRAACQPRELAGLLSPSVSLSRVKTAMRHNVERGKDPDDQIQR